MGALPNLTSNSLYPPGTITPPPGAELPHEPQGKENGKRQNGAPSPGLSSGLGGMAGSAPALPPGASAPEGQGTQRTAAPALGGASSVAQAFQPPPGGAPPVLGDTKRRGRPVAGRAAEAPAGTSGLGTPPVLSNPHRTEPEKTFTERIAEGRRGRKRRREALAKSEFAAGLPTGASPMLAGRYGMADELVVTPAGEIPAALRAPEPSASTVSISDAHARPVVHADRAVRSSRPSALPAEEKAAVTDDSAFEVETPGGPLVAAGRPEQPYRAEPSARLGGQG
ncbi:hypothetical protein FNH05_36780 [Amycolatopsis rhizosphaerae]|uniref:Uncharacterized protein n=1 Tax=Amycolatopsis rhizosphaerae TaxID=2053003 RepID=A0A557ZVP0_9PSEU|nr:hypothetical protein FNH05_36780 [Amycolatopsis rhizosphaerae]